jgi:hypothetical protein
MKKSTVNPQILDETEMNGPMMVDKKMTAQERKKLMEIIKKNKTKTVSKKPAHNPGKTFS